VRSTSEKSSSLVVVIENPFEGEQPNGWRILSA
jgi:hypothetical protein